MSRALLQHRNTPIKGLGLSPAQLLFGRSIKGLLPVRGGDYKPAETWITCREHRELTLRLRVNLGGERWSVHTKALPAGNLAKRWDKTGVVLEDLGFNKYIWPLSFIRVVMWYNYLLSIFAQVLFYPTIL